MNVKKAIVALVAAMAAVALPLVSQGRLSTSEWINVAIAVTGAASVYIAKNLEDQGVVWSYTKAIFSGLAFALTLASSYLTEGIRPAEWSQILVAFVATVGVALTPNESATDAGRHRAVKD